ncbi:hypothetical protein DHD80_11475 [Gramella sp. AN32]|nr:hypothetical protein [Gramella sp. AN32]
MKNLKILIMLLFVSALNFSVISCRETTETEHDDMDDMEMEHDGMKDDDMQMDHEEGMDHEDDHSHTD